MERIFVPEVWDNETNEEETLVLHERQLVAMSEVADSTTIALVVQHLTGIPYDASADGLAELVRAGVSVWKGQEIPKDEVSPEDAFEYIKCIFPAAASSFKSWKSLALTAIYAAENAGAL